MPTLLAQLAAMERLLATAQHSAALARAEVEGARLVGDAPEQIARLEHACVVAQETVTFLCGRRDALLDEIEHDRLMY